MFYVCCRVDGERSPDGDHQMNGDKDGGAEAQEGRCCHIVIHSVTRNSLTQQCDTWLLFYYQQVHPAYLLSLLLPHSFPFSTQY